MVIKYLNILFIVLPLLFQSCSCEREDETADGGPNSPGWVAKQFYTALADEAYYDAMEYCDKSSQRKLENEYYYISEIPEINFIKVDSCDQYEDHAYCYCRYEKEDSTESTHKLLLRNFNELWKVHYEPEDILKGESRLYSDKLIELASYSESPTPITKVIKNELDSVLRESIRIMTDSEFIVGFFSSYDIKDVCSSAFKESSYDEFYIKRTYLQETEASTTFYFGGDNVLSKFEVVILNVGSWRIEGVYQYMIETLIKEFGTPYNAKETPVEHLYRYKEIKWFLQGFNEELIISNEFQNITITLKEAH